jgi:microsomal dipeptidase-like Zn-dependent dipeptidase
MGVEHVGIGADFIAPTGGPHWLDGFSVPGDYAALAKALEQRGYEAVLGANWLRVLG